jgi:hypothetical protein
MLTLPKQHPGGVASPPRKDLVQRVETLRERLVGRARAHGTFGVEGVDVNEGATLLLHGAVNSSTTPHLDAVLDGVISLQPSSLTIDLTQTTAISFASLVAIARRSSKVEHLAIRLPSATSSTLINLVLNHIRGHNNGTVLSQRASLSSRVVPILSSRGV